MKIGNSLLSCNFEFMLISEFLMIEGAKQFDLKL
jgi:hypothetical protein